MEGFLPLKYEILSRGKCLNYLFLCFQRGDIFSNCDNTELQRSSKTNLSVSLNYFCFRAASLGGKGLTADETETPDLRNKNKPLFMILPYLTFHTQRYESKTQEKRS